MRDFVLSPKIIPALRRLVFHYDKKDLHDLRDLIDASLVHVEFATKYDNLNGGSYGHDVILFVPGEMMSLVDLDEQDKIFARMREDLNKAMSEIRGFRATRFFLTQLKI